MRNNVRRKRPLYDCRTCGVCCVSLYEQDVFCDVTEKDMRRLGPAFCKKYVLAPNLVTQLLEHIDGRRHNYYALATRPRVQRAGDLRGVEVCACAMLRGSVMNRVSCRIYDKRPVVCRQAVKPGDRTCRALRSMIQEVIDETIDDTKL